MAILFWDVLRLGSCLAALIVIGSVPFAITKPRMAWDQKLRMLGEMAVCAGIVGAYLYQLGTMPEQWWRNLLIFTGVCLLAVGHYRFLQRYRRAESRSYRR